MPIGLPRLLPVVGTQDGSRCHRLLWDRSEGIRWRTLGERSMGREWMPVYSLTSVNNTSYLYEAFLETTQFKWKILPILSHQNP